MQATRNKIVNYDSVNLQTGIRYSKPVNVNGVYNINSDINYSMPARFLKGTIEIGGRTGYFKTNSLSIHLPTILRHGHWDRNYALI